MRNRKVRWPAADLNAGMFKHIFISSISRVNLGARDKSIRKIAWD